MTPYRHIRQAMIILLCVVAAAGIVSFCFWEPAEQASYIDAYQFVKSWNTLAQEENNLTGGVKINAATGWHTFRLGKGAVLHYRVEKAGILHRKITLFLYKNPHFSESKAITYNQLAALMHTEKINMENYKKQYKSCRFMQNSPFQIIHDMIQ